MVRSSPGWPGLAWRGARLVDDLKCALPKPPLPPLEIVTRLADLGEIGNQRLAIFLVHLRADWHLQNDVLAVGAGAVLAHAVAAALRLEMLLIAIVDQGVETGDRLDDHIAALAAVAAVWAAKLDEFLAPERHAAVPARAGRDIDLGFIEEFHGVRVYRIAAIARPG